MDQYIFYLLNQFAGRWEVLDAVAIFAAKYLGYVLIFGLLLFLAKNYKKYWPLVVKAIGAAIVSRFVITEIIRWIWERPRPFVENNVNLLISHEATGSFPSGHAAFYFAIAAVVYFYNKKAGIAFFATAFLMGIARVFVGVHWPTDILGGAVVGIITGWLVVKLSKKT